MRRDGEPAWGGTATGGTAADVPLTALQVESWRLLRDEWAADAGAQAEWCAWEAGRTRAQPEIAELAREFLSGAVDAAALRAAFDRRTRTQWDAFGLRGVSGAMFLNRLVKHARETPLSAGLDAALRAALRVPDDAPAAGARLAAFAAYGRDAGPGAQPALATAFVSAWWHLQAPAAWPSFQPSTRQTLAAEEGVFVPTGDPVTDYLAFRAAAGALAAALALHPWALEHLCWWQQRRDPALAFTERDADDADGPWDGAPDNPLGAPCVVPRPPRRRAARASPGRPASRERVVAREHVAPGSPPSGETGWPRATAWTGVTGLAGLGSSGRPVVHEPNPVSPVNPVEMLFTYPGPREPRLHAHTDVAAERVVERSPAIEPAANTPAHTHVQWILARLGRRLGCRVWVAANDHHREWQGERLGALSVDHLPPLGLDADSQRLVELIDVVWLRGPSQVAAAFEVERTTSVHAGLLRMADLAALAPNLAVPLYVVVPEERLPKVRRELRRPALQALDLHRRCGFFSAEALEAAAPEIARWASGPEAIDRLAERLGAEGTSRGER